MNALKLPIGIQNFNILRSENYLYVDKTKFLVSLINEGRVFFLSRPRRFGKSLMLSTLEEMFKGNTDLFEGLYAYDWVKEQSKHPNPVLYFDMSQYSDELSFDKWINKNLTYFADDYNLNFKPDDEYSLSLVNILRSASNKLSRVVILIDEYDSLILDNIIDSSKAELCRDKLRIFYRLIKSCDRYIKFIMITGISRFTKAGIFSAMNNLYDISMVDKYASLSGYTSDEIEKYFNYYLQNLPDDIDITGYSSLFDKIRFYYDGYSFDGISKVYNPFSILNFFANYKFNNFWFLSCGSTSLVKFILNHKMYNPEKYAGLKVRKTFCETHEIDKTTPESFLFQSGYLTIKEKYDDNFIIDYTNYEVRSAIADIYAEDIYCIHDFVSIQDKLLKYIKNSNIDGLLSVYNHVLANIPYDYFVKDDDGFYKAIFIVLLKSTNISVESEVHSSLGRSDIIIKTDNNIIIFEFKIKSKNDLIDTIKNKGEEQIMQKQYLQPYEEDKRDKYSYVIIIDREKRQAII
ncbi:MAG: AAA family ATPase [Desulfovibrionaceae bacterium]|nr:AAA family ATPase [Desulfovibrionaceae bacterium]